MTPSLERAAARAPCVRGGFLYAARGSVVRSAATGATRNNLGAVVLNVADEGAMPRYYLKPRAQVSASTKGEGEPYGGVIGFSAARDRAMSARQVWRSLPHPEDDHQESSCRLHRAGRELSVQVTPLWTVPSGATVR
jgi:hypothetical protein